MYKSNRTTVPVTLTLLLLLQSAASEGQGNQVTVKKRGGDYSDPIAAANNAYQGDAWCVSPQLPEHPCVIRIRPGIYVLPETLVVPTGVALVGQGADKVMLLAGKGLQVAVASYGPLVADLSILNDEPDGAALVFGAELRRVKLRADAVALTNAWVFEVEDALFDITDSDISANRIAIDVAWIGRAEPFFARHSRITGGAIGIRIERSGVAFDSSSPLSVLLLDCEITARASDVVDSLKAVEISDSILVKIIGGSLSAEDARGGFSPSAAVDVHFEVEVGELQMFGTRVFGRVVVDSGPGGALFDGVTIVSPTEGIDVFFRHHDSGSIFVRRSRIDAPVALDSRSDTVHAVEIDDSFIMGDVLSDLNPTQIRSSVLTGLLSGIDITCTDVYDADYVLHSNDCPTN